MTGSPDPEVSDRLERLVAELAPPEPEFTVLDLKKADADVVADLLEGILKEGDDQDNGDPSFARSRYAFDPSSGRRDATGRLARHKPLKIIPWNCPQHITQRYTLAEVKEAAEIDPDLLRSCCPDEGEPDRADHGQSANSVAARRKRSASSIH